MTTDSTHSVPPAASSLPAQFAWLAEITVRGRRVVFDDARGRLPQQMINARRWLLWESVPNEDPMKKPRKVPYYVDGTPRHSALDTDQDRTRLASWHDAIAGLVSGAIDTWNDVGIGFALGPDGTGNYWQGFDADGMTAEAVTAALVSHDDFGYIEVSPSGKGLHVIGYGRRFKTLGSNGSGVEAYAERRFFTFTGGQGRGQPSCIAAFVEDRVTEHHRRTVAASAGTGMYVGAKTVTELRSALDHLAQRAIEYHEWINIGIALSELEDQGRGLWLTWSRYYPEFNEEEALCKWRTFTPDRTGYRAVFAKAMAAGWVNPASNAARIDSPGSNDDSGPRRLIGRSMDGVQVRAIDWLWTGWIPRKYITLIVGESGAGKSTVLADIVARITTGKPWPGESEWRAPGRVLWLGSEDGVEDMTAPRLDACGAIRSRVVEIQGVKQGKGRATFSMQDDLGAVVEWLKFAHDENDPFVMLVIDPITSYLSGRRLRKVDMNDTGQLRSILEPWFEVAQTYNLAISSVTHFNKDATRSMLHRVTGSAVFAQTCRSLCAMVEREDDGAFEKAMVQVKVNLPEHPGGAWRFRTEKVTVGHDTHNHKPINATRPAWGVLDREITAQGLMGGERGPVSKTPETFGMWVNSYFGERDPNHYGLKAEEVFAGALHFRVCSKRWWNEHSGKYLEKKNAGGTWWCRPLKH